MRKWIYILGGIIGVAAVLGVNLSLSVLSEQGRRICWGIIVVLLYLLYALRLEELRREYNGAFLIALKKSLPNLLTVLCTTFLYFT